MKRLCIFDKEFLNTVESWFEATHDIFVVVRYSAMAGAKEYFWLREFETFMNIIWPLPPQADVMVFRRNQFPLRGVADNDLLQDALIKFNDNSDLMIIEHAEPPDSNVGVRYTDSHAELIEKLTDPDDLVGLPISVGEAAPWHENDNEDMISALVPLPDGNIKRGVY